MGVRWRQPSEPSARPPRGYPERALVPFARRQDNDDVACWEAGQGEQVFIVHDYASPGWERRGVYPNFYVWLRQAVEDMIEYDQQEDQ